MTDPATVILCADDYGLAPGVGRSIRALAAAGRLSATSCMTVFPDWHAEAAALRPLAGRIEIGLHLTLTDQAPLGPMPGLAPAGRLPSVGRLAALAWRRRLDAGEVAAEIGRQLDAFESAMGRPPGFVDGHQHAHLLPGVREAVLALFAGRLDPRRAWLRSGAEPIGRILARGVAVGRAAAISAAARPLARMAAKRGVAVNDSFRGVTDFRPGRAVDALFRRYLDGPGRRPLVMCHPGLVDETLADRDPVTAWREAEHRYLAGDAFAADLAAAGRALAPFPFPP